MAFEEEQRALRALAEAWGVALSPAGEDGLLAYGRLLLAWNARINLTGADSLRELIDEHFVDAFAVASRLPPEASVLDVGSGGGLPALPAAILAATVRVRLVEPVRKKGAFLRTAIRQGGLSGRVRVSDGRVEDVVTAAERGSFDVAMSRATFAPRDWLLRAHPLVRVGGKVLALSAEAEVEIPPGLLVAGRFGYAGGRRWLWDLTRST